MSTPSRTPVMVVAYIWEEDHCAFSRHEKRKNLEGYHTPPISRVWLPYFGWETVSIALNKSGPQVKLQVLCLCHHFSICLLIILKCISNYDQVNGASMLGGHIPLNNHRRGLLPSCPSYKPLRIGWTLLEKGCWPARWILSQAAGLSLCSLGLLLIWPAGL